MSFYRKKPVVIEAIQWDGNNGAAISDFIGFTKAVIPLDGKTSIEAPNPLAYITIQTLEGQMNARVGDWIIKGVKGEFYPCKPDIFEESYEPTEGTRA